MVRSNTKSAGGTGKARSHHWLALHICCNQRTKQVSDARVKGTIEGVDTLGCLSIVSEGSTSKVMLQCPSRKRVSKRIDSSRRGREPTFCHCRGGGRVCKQEEKPRVRFGSANEERGERGDGTNVNVFTCEPERKNESERDKPERLALCLRPSGGRSYETAKQTNHVSSETGSWLRTVDEYVHLHDGTNSIKTI